MPEEYIITPGGYRPKSLVHTIEPEHAVRVVNGRLHKVRLTGEFVADLGPLERRPGPEPLMPKNVHVPRGPVPGRLAEGWIISASFTNRTGSPVTDFRTTWTVPDPPSSDSGQLIYLFNGMQDSTLILQPVLQWGVSDGGGSNWYVASWVADGKNGPATHTPLVPVQPGQTLTGVMRLVSTAGNKFTYTCAFEGIPLSLKTLVDSSELKQCVETLEAYRVQKCTNYPAAAFTAMRNITITCGTMTPSISWRAANSVTDCGQHCAVISNSAKQGQVDLCYQSPIDFDVDAPPPPLRPVLDLNGDGKSDVLVFRPSDGYFGKWYSDGGTGPDFKYQAARHIGGAPNTLPGAQLIPCDFTGTVTAFGKRKTDILVFRPADGYFGKWYSDGSIGPDFKYQAARYIGGSANALSDAQLIPCDFTGSGRTDILVFRPSDGYFGKWYSDGGIGPDFKYQAARYIGGSPNALSGARLIPCDFTGSGRTDILVFRPSDGYFAKWYSDGSVGPDFNDQPAQFIGGSPGNFPGAHLIPCHFTGAGTDFLVFRSADGYFGKWYSDGTVSPVFNYQAARHIGGAPGAYPGVQPIPCHFNGGTITDILVFRSGDGYFAKWYSDGTVGADFNVQLDRFIGGSPYALPGAQLIPCDFTGSGRTDILVFRSSDGYFGKWYSDGSIGPDFKYQTQKHIGGSPGALPGAELICTWLA